MHTFVRDLRVSLRMLANHPGFTAVAVLSLGLGIGANTTIFTIVNALFLRALPVAEPGRLMFVYTQDARNPGYLPQSYSNYLDYRDLNQVFSGLLLYTSMRVSYTGGGEPQQLAGQIVTGNYFQVLGVKPIVGRAFRPEEDRVPGAYPVAVISHSLWTNKFAANPAIPGARIDLDGHRFTIIGVAPKGFRGLNALVSADLWVPMMMYQQVYPMAQQFNSRRALLFACVGRLKPGMSPAQAEAGMKTVAAQLEAAHPRENQGRGATLLPLAEATINRGVRGDFVRAGRLLMAVVGLVLVIACVNVANLLLARAGARRKEIALRLALGATRARIIRQLLTESLVLALLSGLAGLVIATWGRALLWALRPPFLNNVELDLGLSLPVLLFSLVLSLATGFLFGLAPALETTRTDLVTELKERTSQFFGAPRAGSLRNLLVIGQVALSLVALIGAGLFVRSLRNFENIDPGFETSHLLILSYDLGMNSYNEPRGREFHRLALERVRTLPYVQSASLAANVPFGAAIARTVLIEGQESAASGKGNIIRLDHVEPEYFRTVGIAVIRGRSFTPLDAANTPGVAIINQAMARTFWPDAGGTGAIGKRFSFFGETRQWQIVGIVRDANYLQLGERPQANIYIPLAQSYVPRATLHVRTTGDPAAVIGSIRRAVQALDSKLLLNPVETMGEVISESLWAPRTGGVLLSGFGLLALALAIVGIYGVISYTVNQRVRDIGIRMALGASPRDVLKVVLTDGMTLVGAGVAVGIGCALLVTHLLSSFLFEVSTTDPLTFAAVSLVLALVALAACWLPARKAMKVHPAIALRHQ